MDSKAPSPAAFTQGPTLLGCTICLVLYGVLIGQICLWSITCNRYARIWMKLFIWFLLLAETLTTLSIVVYLWQSLIMQFGDVPHLRYATKVFALEPGLTAIIACAVQLFYAKRIMILTAKTWISVCIAAVALIQLFAGIGLSIGIWMILDFAEYYKLRPVGSLWMMSSFIADIAITSTLLWYLVKTKAGPTIASSNSVNKIVVLLIVQTGLVTSIVIMVEFTLWIITDSTMYIVVNMPLSKIYTNSLLCMLNSSVRIRQTYRRSTYKVADVLTTTGSLSMLDEFADLSSSLPQSTEVAH